MRMQESSDKEHRQRRREAADAASHSGTSLAVGMSFERGVEKTDPPAGGGVDCKSLSPSSWIHMRRWSQGKGAAWTQTHGWLPAACDHSWTCPQLVHWPGCRAHTGHQARSAFSWCPSCLAPPLGVQQEASGLRLLQPGEPLKKTQGQLGASWHVCDHSSCGGELLPPVMLTAAAAAGGELHLCEA